MLQAVGSAMQDKYDNSLKDLNTSTDPIGKLNLQAGLKIYDKTAPGGITDVSTKWEDHKSQYMKMLDDERQSIVDEYLKDQDTNKFNQRKNQYINKAKMIHSDLASKEQIAKQIVKQNEELSKNEDFAKRGYLANKQIAYNTQYFNSLMNEGNVGEYIAPSVAKSMDRPKEIVDYFSKLPSELQTSFASSTGNGYIRSKYREGVSADKIRNTFDAWFDNSESKHDIDLEVNDYFARSGDNPNELIPVRDPNTGEVIKNKQGEVVKISKYDYYTDLKKDEALNQALGFISSKGSDKLASDATYRWKTDKNEEQAAARQSLVGDPTESKYNLDLRSPEFKDQISKGNLIENSDGTISIGDLTTIEKPIIGYTQRKVGDQLHSMPIYGKPITKDDKIKEVGKLLGTLAYKLGKPVPKTIEEQKKFLTEYNAYSKVRLYDEQMSDQESMIESDKFKRNYDNYDFMKQDSPVNLEGKSPDIKQTDKIILNKWITSPDGKMLREGFIENKDGDKTPILVRPKAIINDSYHNNITQLGLEGAKREMGEIKDHIGYNDVMKAKVYKPKQLNSNIIVEPFMLDSNPGVIHYNVYGKDANGNEFSENANNYGELMQIANSKYYSTSKVGGSEASKLNKKQNQYEDLTQETED